MLLHELDFEVPAELIAQHPVHPRDSCRLMRLSPASGAISDHSFNELPSLLRAGDLLVVNDSRVLPARLRVTKETGGAVELLFLQPAPGAGPDERETWQVLARPSGRLRPGMVLGLHGLSDGIELVSREGEGRWLAAGPKGASVTQLLLEYGEMPLPPYMKAPLGTPDDYQTVYSERLGSAAAPTAGLHFTPALLARLAACGIATARVTLHVGLDTFRPIEEEIVESHRIHTERYEVDGAELDKIRRARSEGRRLVAVGSTSVRVLETLFSGEASHAEPHSASDGAGGGVSGAASLFISPGYRFRAVDALITNFHLPRTTLVAMVMAFAGPDLIREAYRLAVARRYRFFSFGDAMLIDAPAEGSARVAPNSASAVEEVASRKVTP